MFPRHRFECAGIAPLDSQQQLGGVPPRLTGIDTAGASRFRYGYSSSRPGGLGQVPIRPAGGPEGRLVAEIERLGSDE